MEDFTQSPWHRIEEQLKLLPFTRSVLFTIEIVL